MYAMMPILTFGDITQLGATITPSPSITDEHMTLEGCITVGNRKPLPSYQTSSPPKNQDKGFLTLLLMDLH